MQTNKTPAYLGLPEDHCFDYQYLMEVLKRYRSPRDKVSLMLRRGEIVRVRKGLYVRSREFGGRIEPVEMAGAIYGPSYVSLEYALSDHGLIPEAVHAVTSMTTRRARDFQTPLSPFYYRHIHAGAFSVGVSFERRRSVGILIATPEKAVCDKLACTPGIRTLKEIESFVVEDQRMDTDEIAGFSHELLREIQLVYELKRIGLFFRWFEKNFYRETQ